MKALPPDYEPTAEERAAMKKLEAELSERFRSSFCVRGPDGRYSLPRLPRDHNYDMLCTISKQLAQLEGEGSTALASARELPIPANCQQPEAFQQCWIWYRDKISRSPQDMVRRLQGLIGAERSVGEKWDASEVPDATTIGRWIARYFAPEI